MPPVIPRAMCIQKALGRCPALRIAAEEPIRCERCQRGQVRDYWPNDDTMPATSRRIASGRQRSARTIARSRATAVSTSSFTTM